MNFQLICSHYLLLLLFSFVFWQFQFWRFIRGFQYYSSTDYYFENVVPNCIDSDVWDSMNSRNGHWIWIWILQKMLLRPQIKGNGLKMWLRTRALFPIMEVVEYWIHIRGALMRLSIQSMQASYHKHRSSIFHPCPQCLLAFFWFSKSPPLFHFHFLISIQIKVSPFYPCSKIKFATILK
jgi:hypothetical protein